MSPTVALHSTGVELSRSRKQFNLRVNAIAERRRLSSFYSSLAAVRSSEWLGGDRIL